MKDFELQTTTAQTNLKPYLTQPTRFSKILAAIVFITLPFVGFFLGYNFSIPSHPQPPTTSTPTKATDPQTKRAFLGGEIPISWNEYKVGEAKWVTDYNYYSPETITYSVGRWEVSFPPNFTQINFRFMTEAAGDQFIAEASLEASTTVKEVTFDNVPITVIEWPLDDGSISPGSSAYLMKIKSEPNSPGYLFINKVGRDDALFEQEFAHMLETMDFQYAQNYPWYSYESMGMD